MVGPTGNISATAGPVGGGAQVAAALQHPAPMFSYTRSKGKSFRQCAPYETLTYFFSEGLFAGVSLEGTVLVERKEANRAFYGSAMSVSALKSTPLSTQR